MAKKRKPNKRKKPKKTSASVGPKNSSRAAAKTSRSGIISKSY